MVRGATTYDIKEDSGNSTAISDYSILADLPKKAVLKSYLGTEIKEPIYFKGGSYQIYRNGKINTIELSDFRLPSTTIVNFKRAKKITITNLAGSNGTVKEMYGFGDWQIELKGRLINDPKHPQATSIVAQKKKLKQWEELADAIKVEADAFADLDIFYLVIKDIQITKVMGKPNALDFQINAISDEPIELM